jgi:hypothetical protein
VTTYWFRICSLLAFLFVVLIGAPEARADKKKAMEHWKKGNTAYTLGKFDAAIGHFETAYVEHPAPAFLFNIAQCHRQLRACKKASFFYRRYLSAKPDADNRPEVEGYIKEAEAMCAGGKKPVVKKPVEPVEKTPVEPVEKTPVEPVEKTPVVKKPVDTKPDRVAVVGHEGGGDGSAVVGGGADPEGGLVTETEPGPSILASMIELGPSFLSIGEFDVPTQFSVRISVGYPLSFGAIGVEPGILFNTTPVKYDDASAGTANLVSLLANVPVTYAVANKIKVRGEFGLGVLVFTGLNEGNPFTTDGRGTTGGLSMFNLRFALGADYEITDKIVASVTPLAIAQSPAKEGLHDSVESIVRFDVLVGVGYRF